MPGLRESIALLESDALFKEWKERNPESYLCHCFRLLDEPSWQIGFFDPKETITAFTVRSNGVEQATFDEIFREPDKKILPLSFSEIVLDDETALNHAKSFAQMHYPKEVIVKDMAMVHATENGVVYSITFLTIAMNSLIIKVSASDGTITNHQVVNLANFVSEKHSKK